MWPIRSGHRKVFILEQLPRFAEEVMQAFTQRVTETVVGDFCGQRK